VTGTDWAWIIAAGFWGLLVIALCLVLLNVFRLITQVGDLVEGVTDETVPLIAGVGETVSGINVQLARVDDVLAGVQHMTATADSLATVVHATISNPLIKVAAFAVGARKGARRLFAD
jgi:methyl-accepting chemotaxis protein